DWFNMLNRGVVRTGVAGADEHGRESAFLRTMLRTGGTSAPFVDEDTVVEALRAHRAVVTNGPMNHLDIDGAEVGDTLKVAAGAELHRHGRVEKAPWYDVDRLEIYRNGHLVQWANGCERARGSRDEDPDPNPCLATGDTALVWEQTLVDRPD